MNTPDAQSPNPLRIACPSCGRHLRIREEFFGKKVVCPGCKAKYLARRPESARDRKTNPPTNSGASANNVTTSDSRARTSAEPARQRPVQPGPARSGSAQSEPPQTDPLSADPPADDTYQLLAPDHQTPTEEFTPSPRLPTNTEFADPLTAPAKSGNDDEDAADFLGEMARLRVVADELPPPPRWPFLSGVFTFPFYRRSLPTWILSAIGMIVGIELGVMAFELGNLIGIGFFMPALLLMEIGSLSYLANRWFTVIQATADGYDEIRDWPEFDMRDWLAASVSMIYLFIVSGGLGASLQVLPGLPDWIWVWVGTAALFPYFVLSGLEANSILVPASAAVTRSLFSNWTSWLTFYVETTLLLIGAGWLIDRTFQLNPYICPLVACPIFTAGMLIYGRLLGRLARQATFGVDDEDEDSDESDSETPAGVTAADHADEDDDVMTCFDG